MPPVRELALSSYFATVDDPRRDLASVALVEAQRTADGRTTTEQRYYLLDQIRAPHEADALVQGHWGIENCVHWLLDVVYASCMRTGHAPQNIGSDAPHHAQSRLPGAE